MRNKIQDLRNHLFAALETISECSGDEEIRNETKKANAIASIANSIIKLATVEVQFYAATRITPSEDGLFIKAGGIKKEISAPPKVENFLDEFITRDAPTKEVEIAPPSELDKKVLQKKIENAEKNKSDFERINKEVQLTEAAPYQFQK